MIRKITSLIIGAAILFMPSIVNAEELLISVSGGKIVLQDDTRAIVKMDVTNNSDSYYPNLYYIPSLSFPSGKIKEFSAKDFELGNRETKTLVYDCKLPENILEENMDFSATFYEKSGTVPLKTLVIKLNPVIKNTTNFVNITDAYIEKDGKKSDEFSGNATLKITAEAKNGNVNSIPKVEIFRRDRAYENKAVYERYLPKANLKKGKKAIIEEEIPSYAVKDKYTVKITFLDESLKEISTMKELSFVADGEMARVEGIKITNNGNEITVKTEITGSKETAVLSNAVASSELKDSLGNLIAKKYNAISLSEKTVNTEFKFDVSGRMATENLTLDIYVTAGNKELTKTTATIKLIKLNAETSTNFKDIKGLKCEEAVKLLNGLGILNGYPDGSFKPENNVTRAEFSIISVKLDEPEVYKNSKSRFYDVEDAHWANKYISYAAEKGFVSGYPDGSFLPGNSVKYSEALTILLNMMGYRDEISMSVLSWPKNYVNRSLTLGLHNETIFADEMLPANRGDVALITWNAYLKK